MNQRLAWPAVVLAGVAMAAIAVMAIAGVDRETILLCILGLVGPVLTAMVAAQVSEVKSKTDVVERQTNGNQSELLKILGRQMDLLATSTPAAPAAAQEDRPAA